MGLYTPLSEKSTPLSLSICTATAALHMENFTASSLPFRIVTYDTGSQRVDQGVT